IPSRLIRRGRPPLLAALHAAQPLRSHQSGDPLTAGVGDAAPAKLLPRLADAVGGAVALASGVDLPDQLGITHRPSRRLPGSARIERAHRHVQHTADRLDPEDTPPRLDVGGHLRRVGSSSPAKYTLASFRIALARRSSA